MCYKRPSRNSFTAYLETEQIDPGHDSVAKSGFLAHPSYPDRRIRVQTRVQIGLFDLQIALSGTQKTTPPLFGWPRVLVLSTDEANPRLLNVPILNYERVSFES
jgi:hypothetical protein